MGCPCQSCRSGKGLFSCADAEAAACNLLRVGLVHIGHDFFESGRVKPLTQNIRIADDVTACSKLFGITLEHLGFDGVSQSFSFGLGFLDQFLEGSQALNLWAVSSVVDIFVCSFLLIIFTLL